MRKIKEMFHRYRQQLAYLFFGLLTTGVNYLIYLLASRLFSVPPLSSNVLAWIGSVVFAYFTNRRWVFHSSAEGGEERGREFLKFTTGRLFSLGVEEGILYLGLRLPALASHDILLKTAAQVLVVILNYLLSKFFVFKEKEGQSS